MRRGLVPSKGTAYFNGPRGRPLDIVAEVQPFLGHGHASIALLTDGDEWYSAEVVFTGQAYIAYAVNGYSDRFSAEEDALKRGRLD